MGKQIKIEDDVHARLSRYCTRDRTYGQCIADLLTGEPFVSRLKEVLPRILARIESAKQSGRSDPSMADDLVRVAQWIIESCEQRSGKGKGDKP